MFNQGPVSVSLGKIDDTIKHGKHMTKSIKYFQNIHFLIQYNIATF